MQLAKIAANHRQAAGKNVSRRMRAAGTIPAIAYGKGEPACSPLRGGDCPTYGGTLPARHFIEFAAGTFKRIGLKKGDKVAWELRLPDGSHLRTGGADKKAETKPKKAR